LVPAWSHKPNDVGSMMIKNFLSNDCVSDLLDKLSTETWSDKDAYIPLKITRKIDMYPLLKKELLDQVGVDIFKEDNIYFSKYLPGASCNMHPDPCKYTVVVLLQDCLDGGDFMLKNRVVNLSPGDAILFRGNTSHSVTKVVSGTRIALALWLNSVSEQYQI